MEEEEENARRCKEFIDALEEERRKIQVFHRELPLTMQIVSQAIEKSRQQLAVETLFLDGPDNEGNSTEGPVVGEYIPESSCLEEEKNKETTEEPTTKRDWQRSLHLYDQDADLHSSLPLTEFWIGSASSSVAIDDRSTPSEEKSRMRAFQPFCRDPNLEPIATAISAEGKGGHKKVENFEPSQKKPRRCWSSELHHLFLDALQQLGGSSAATPKQIRELMKVEGLTNDEVKSHLQKYRLHTRRMRGSTEGSPPFFVVGGIWVPSPEYAAAAVGAGTMTQSTETADAPRTEIYRPLARFPPGVESQHKRDLSSPTGPLHSEGWASAGDNAIQISPSVSSS